MATLKPNKDINDIIVDLYLTLIKTHFIDVSIHSKCDFFSMYFITQLISNDFITNERHIERIGRAIPPELEKRVQKATSQCTSNPSQLG
jgi:Ulp1 family protease